MNTYKTLKLFLLVVIITIISCSPITKESVNQMKVNVANNEIQLDTKNSWEPVGQTFLIISIADTSNLTCLFVAEAIGGKISGENITTPVEVRILIDGEICSPASAGFVPDVNWVLDENFSSQSFLATKRNIKPGTHNITVEWNQTTVGNVEKNPRMRNRTLTVWQTVEE